MADSYNLNSVVLLLFLMIYTTLVTDLQVNSVQRPCTGRTVSTFHGMKHLVTLFSFYRILDAIDQLQESLAIEVNESATFVRNKFAIHLDESTVNTFSGITFLVGTDIDALSSNGFDDMRISTVPREEVNRTGACSFSLPTSLLDDLRNANQLEANQTIAKFSYTVFSDDTFFQPHQGFKVGSVVVSATLAGIERIDNLTRPTKMQFQISEVRVQLELWLCDMVRT